MGSFVKAEEDREQQVTSLHDSFTCVARITAALAVLFAVSLTPMEAAHARGAHIHLSGKIGMYSKKLVQANVVLAAATGNNHHHSSGGAANDQDKLDAAQGS